MQLTISSYLAAALVFAAIGQALPLEQVHEAVLAQVNAPRGGGVFPASVDKTLIKIEYPEVEALLPSEDDKVISGGLVLEGGLEGITAPARRASAPADIELQNNVARKYHGPPPRQPGIQARKHRGGPPRQPGIHARAHRAGEPPQPEDLTTRAYRAGAPPQPEGNTAKRASAPADIELQINVARKNHGAPPRQPGIQARAHRAGAPPQPEDLTTRAYRADAPPQPEDLTANRASAPSDIELQSNVARKHHGPPPRQPGIQVRANRIGAPPQPENRTAKRASAPSDIELQNNVARKHHGPPRLPGIYIPPHGKSSAAQEAREPAVLRRRWLPGGVWHEGPGQHWP